MNPYLTSQDEAKLIKPVIIKYNHMSVKCAIRHVWSVKGKHNVRHMVRLVGKVLNTVSTNIKQAAYSLLAYPSIELSTLQLEQRLTLQLHQLATMILESSLVYSSDNYIIGIVLHPVVGILQG